MLLLKNNLLRKCLPGDLFTKQRADQHALDCSVVTSIFRCLVLVILCSHQCHLLGPNAEVSVEGKP